MLRNTLLTRCYLLLSFSVLLLDVHVDCVHRELNINLDIVHQWADLFTARLHAIAETATGVDYFENNYEQRKKEMIVSNKDRINETLEKVRDQLERVLKDKEKAVRKMMEAAEKANEEYGAYKKPEQLDPEEIPYYNAKKLVSDINLLQMSTEMKEDIKKTIHYLPLDGQIREFNYNDVNLNVSTIHVPTNIYDKSTKILNGVSWSENITSQFIENTKTDHSLTWQYFCSSDGFFRIYPGIIWPRDPDKVDMFDCRVRNWYIQAATTPKNIVILMDASGSMKGLRMEIARNTVDKILDTLSNDDYFNILEFSEEVSYVDECFNRTLMQASVDNLRRMQEEIKQVGTFRMANFQKALVEAFKLFETVEKDLGGTLCNKAIMLVTDGAPENYEETFEMYNWPNKTIRVFTYLIGKEVSDNRQVKWMACANKGDHKHISTRADVQENVQQYIKVLSRPMVQNGYHNLVWTAAYVDYVTEQSPMTDSVGSPFSSSQSDLLSMVQGSTHNKGLGLMITAAMPVFDRRKLMEDDEEMHDGTYSGNLLGVVGTDVRTFDIKKHIPLHKLGVNGYAFAITNHGYIIFHPDFRPLYQKIKLNSDLSLKPNYNSVDLTEVELADDINILKELRRGMLETTHSSIAMNVTIHYDEMRRYRKRSNLYFFKKVSNVFSLAFVIPKGYGEHRISLQYIRKREDEKRLNHQLVFLAPWIFCRNTSNNQLVSLTKEDLMLILEGNHSGGLKCDEDLLNNLVYDAAQTFQLSQIWEGIQEYSPRGKPRSSLKNEYEQCFTVDKSECYKKTYFKHGIELLFVGTSVGLTRMMATVDYQYLTDAEFPPSSYKTIEEPYYKRAVDGWQDGYNYTFHLRKTLNGAIFDPNSTTIIMSTAEVLNDRGKMAVTAVIGLQMRYTSFLSLFENITSECPEGRNCDFTCNDTDYLNCYLLDQSGFVMASNNKDGNDTGKFFGMVDGSLMKELTRENIYDSMTVMDYQGVCKVYSSDQENSASRLLNPLMKMLTSFLLSIAEIFIIFSQWSFYGLSTLFNMVRGDFYEDAKNNKDPILRFYASLVIDFDTQEHVLDDHVVDQKACDKQVTLFNLNVTTLKKENRNGLTKSITGCGECSRFSNGTYIVRWIQNTNLILVVAAANCSCGDGEEISLTQEKVIYDEVDKCKRVGKVSHPQRKTHCYDSTKEKGSRCCGATSRSSLMLLGLLVLKALLS